MTKDIIKMAQEAGFAMAWMSHEEHQCVERFAKLVRNDYSNKHAQLWLKRIDDAVKAEREACAKVCDPYTYGQWFANAIRARGETC